MRMITKQDVDEAWENWATIEGFHPAQSLRDDAFTPTTALRMIAHLRFSSMFCDYVLQNEPERIVETSTLDVIRAASERQCDLQEWREDWEILPASAAKDRARRRLAQCHRARMELVCIRHLWLASQAWGHVKGRRDWGGHRNT
jgi:hypothetical protein